MKKKIYLVRDYCNAAGIKSEKPMLIELSGKDFYNLVTSLEGERRFFVHLTDDVGYECPEIYAEVSEEEYKDWKSEYDSHLYRKRIKQMCYREGLIKTKATNDEEKSSYEMYYDFSEKINRIPSHRILAINRGEKEDFLKVSFPL